MNIPCFVLAFLSIVGRICESAVRGDSSRRPAAGCRRVARSPITEIASEGIAALVFLLGRLLAYIFFLRKRAYATALASSAVGRALHRFWFADWGMDWLYDRLFVRPLVWFAHVDKGDFIDGFYTGVAG